MIPNVSKMFPNQNNDFLKNNEKYFCELCCYSSKRKSNYNKHIKSQKHILNEKCCENATFVAKSATFVAKSATFVAKKKQKCEICNYETIHTWLMVRHMKSMKHKNNCIKQNVAVATFVAKKKQKCENGLFKCDICDYTSKQKPSLKRHYYKKHLNVVHSQIKPNSETNQKVYICEYCDKEYGSRSGLYKHKQKCNEKERVEILKKSNETQLVTKDSVYGNNDVDDLKNMVIDLVNTNKSLMDLVKSPHTTNNTTNNNTTNNNNTINRNTYIENYLNIECKDAINMSEFLNSLKITLEDLLYLGNNGFTKSVQKILMTSLKNMEETMRPIHCTNKKKKTLYIKDDNNWEKDNDHNKLKNTIDVIHRKETSSATEHMDSEYFGNDDKTFVEKNNIIIKLAKANKTETLTKLKHNISKDLYV
jgi:hypothetical protein